MTHLAPEAIIFSPSVARIAASAAKDWKFVDDWLALRFRGLEVPPFERNAQTLQSLLKLAGLNEAIDEESHLVTRAEASALRLLRPASSPGGETDAALSDKNTLLGVLRDTLSPEAQASLDAMASLSAAVLGSNEPTPEALGFAVVEIHAQITELQELRARMQLIDANMQVETRQVDEMISALQRCEYTHVPDLAKQNLELQRRLRLSFTALPDLETRLAGTTPDSFEDSPRVDRTVIVEKEFLDLLRRKSTLEGRAAQFSGLPDNTGHARDHLDQLRGRLRSQRNQRDALFEGLVERESPHKTH